MANAECQGAATWQDFDHKTIATRKRKKDSRGNEAADMWAIKTATRSAVPDGKLQKDSVTCSEVNEAQISSTVNRCS